jgi:hypothetical protein
MGSHDTVSNDNVIAFAAPGDDRCADQILAEAVTKAAAGLQHAMDDAIKAGLLVEPTFATAEFSSSCVETATETYLINLQVLRRLL